ncbi:MAG TPA: heparan-alpha-glucosaminide N-acetyltransferase domain-containing protein [Methylococcaceae bacterium]|nr:heparan-alpha-glucosaminide N-acetyltransferase domain-containing protein [Methylococcaceae bacterium]
MEQAQKIFDRRVVAIDLVRGMIMVLMALDHTRDFFSRADFDPLDLQKTHAALFLTRWVTHFCAPLFIFLSGASTFLSLARHADPAGQSRLLLTRGALLILLELTLVRWTGWNFGLEMHRVGAGVLWAIGWSMICLSILIRLRLSVVGLVGLIMIVGHNLLDGLGAERFGHWGWLWQILHAGGGFEYGPGLRFVAIYPLIPWIGVMAAGFAFGPVFLRETALRRQSLLHWGMALTAGYVLLRLGNLYGDSARWSIQQSDLYTLLSFLKCTKYPPSLHYLLMTLGPGLILLAVLDRPVPRWLQPVNVFGQVPLFFYVLHLPLIHGLAALVDYGRYGHAPWQFGWPFAAADLPHPPDHGFGLLIVYLATAFVVVCLFPLCRWFAGLKRTSRRLWVRLL